MRVDHILRNIVLNILTEVLSNGHIQALTI